MPSSIEEGLAAITGRSVAAIRKGLASGGITLTQDQREALANREDEATRDRFERMAEDGDYVGALRQLGSHDVASAIVKLDADWGLWDDDLRAVLREHWTRCDAHRHVREEMLDLFRRAGYVSSPERQFDKPITVYRGNLGEDPRLGFSWTLSKAKARWFALYAFGPRAAWLGLDRADGGERIPTVWQATVPPDAILGYFNDRREREVIVDPAKAGSVSVALRPRGGVRTQ